MSTEEQIREKLEDVLVPGSMRSLNKLNLVRSIAFSNGKVDIAIASAALSSASQEWIKAKASDVVKGLPKIKQVNIAFVDSKAKELNEVKHVVAVMSGKGGVGKTLATSL